MANPLKMLKLKPTGFQFIQELPISAPPKKVWTALLDVQNWFRIEGDPKMVPPGKLEPWPGGRWHTEAADGVTALNAIVTLIEPQKLLRMSGPMGLSHLPVNSVFIFELQPRDDGKTTLLRFCQRSFGFMDAGVKQRYSKGWGQFLPQLKELAEKRGK